MFLHFSNLPLLFQNNLYVGVFWTHSSGVIIPSKMLGKDTGPSIYRFTSTNFFGNFSSISWNLDMNYAPAKSLLMGKP